MIDKPIEPKSDQNRWNFWAFVAFFVMQRAAWVLKLESVVMPAFLDALGGTGVTRGLLPILSRIGSGLPQFFIVHRVEKLPRLKFELAFLTLLEGAPWLILGGALLWNAPIEGIFGQVVFLVLYGLFCSFNGMTYLVQGTLQAKLVPPFHRGRLLAFATVGGAVAGIAGVFLWMLPHLKAEAGAPGFGPVFLATGVLFTFTAFIALVFREERIAYEAGHGRFRQFVKSTVAELREQPRFRYLVFVVALYYVFLILFPHYTSYGQTTLGAGSRDMVAWVVIQNVGFALMSVWLGNLADRSGYRLALLIILFCLSLVPVLAVLVGSLGPVYGGRLYWIIFFLLGCAPASQRILTNYVLEFAPPGKESQYLGTVNLVQLLPLAGAPFVGWAMDRWSYEPVFLSGAVILFVAFLLARRLPEPRADVLDASSQA